jgi:hypothetical protein
VKLVLDKRDKDVFPRGRRARHGRDLHAPTPCRLHIIRKVLLRVSSYLNWIIIKHNVSLH